MRSTGCWRSSSSSSGPGRSTLSDLAWHGWLDPRTQCVCGRRFSTTTGSDPASLAKPDSTRVVVRCCLCTHTPWPLPSRSCLRPVAGASSPPSQNAPGVQRRWPPPSLALAALAALPIHVNTIVHFIQVPCRCSAPGPWLLLLLLPRVRRAADKANVRSISLDPHQLEGAPVCQRHTGCKASAKRAGLVSILVAGTRASRVAGGQ